MGTGLAVLHQGPLPAPVYWTPAAHVAEVRNKTEKLSRAFPGLHDAFSELVGFLERRQPRLSPIPLAFLHGDFLPQQLLVQADTLTLLDFDECTRGDPMQDLATFLVNQWLAGHEPRFLDAMTAAFLDAYADAPWGVPMPRLDWHLRLQLLTRAYRLYRQQKPEAGADIPRLVRFALKPALLHHDGNTYAWQARWVTRLSRGHEG